MRLHLTSPVFLFTRALRARINRQPARHLTAVMLAELTGHNDFVKYLVDLGCSVNTPPTLWAARWDNEVSGLSYHEVHGCHFEVLHGDIMLCVCDHQDGLNPY